MSIQEYFCFYKDLDFVNDNEKIIRKTFLSEIEDFQNVLLEERKKFFRIYGLFIDNFKSIDKERKQFIYRDIGSDSIKQKALFRKYLQNKEDAEKIIVKELEKFKKTFVNYKNRHPKPEIDKIVEQDLNENILNPIVIDHLKIEETLKELKKMYPKREESFLKYCIENQKINKEVFVKKEKLEKFEKMNKILFKINLDQFKNFNSKNNCVNNIMNDIKIEDIFSCIKLQIEQLFEFNSYIEKKDSFYLKIGGRLKSNTNITDCYKKLNEIVINNEYVLQGSIYAYRMIEDIILDTELKIPEGLSLEHVKEYNFNISELLDIRDFLRNK